VVGWKRLEALHPSTYIKWMLKKGEVQQEKILMEEKAEEEKR
jgi:hypothetical protein